MRKADIVTLAGGGLAAVGMSVALLLDPILGLRFLLLSYAADVIDGYVARRFDSPDPRGQLLDRALDRVSQIIAPLILVISVQTFSLGNISKLLIVLYASIMIPFSFYRLAYRVSPVGREGPKYFPGAPLFTHTLVMLGGVLVGLDVSLLLLPLALLSIIPVPYLRGRKGGSGSPAFWPRLALLVLIALLPYGHGIGRILGYLLLVAGLGYAVLGWIPTVYYGYSGKNKPI